MPLPPLVRQLAAAKLKNFADDRIPLRIRNEVRIEHTFRGDSVTLVERRPPWRGEGKWTSHAFAQFRYDRDESAWTLYCADSNIRWHRFERAEPTADLDELIDIVNLDETGIFFG